MTQTNLTLLHKTRETALKNGTPSASAARTTCR